jgi:bacterioferritin (cytochrome b1)
MQRYFPVKVGEDAIEQHRLDLQVEYDAVKRLNAGITLCGVVEAIGKERYLAEQMMGAGN